MGNTRTLEEKKEYLLGCIGRVLNLDNVIKDKSLEMILVIRDLEELRDQIINKQEPSNDFLDMIVESIDHILKPLTDNKM